MNFVERYKEATKGIEKDARDYIESMVARHGEIVLTTLTNESAEEEDFIDEVSECCPSVLSEWHGDEFNVWKLAQTDTGVILHGISTGEISHQDFFNIDHASGRDLVWLAQHIQDNID